MKPFDASGRYCPTVSDKEISRLAIKGAGATMVSGGLGVAVQAVSMVVLARLLTPADFGVVTMVTTFSLLLMNVGLNGFTEAVIQREEINADLISNIFWINAGVGLLFTIAFAAGGGVLAAFYHDPIVKRVALGMSATILLTSLSVQHFALLKRALRFSETSAVDFTSRAFSLIVSIAFACLGWGYWALVLGAIAQPFLQLVFALYLCPWVPRLPKRVPGTGAMVSFALHVYGRFSVGYWSRNADNLLVGLRFGAVPLGFYKKAYDLFALSASNITGPLTNLAVSALSKGDPHSPQYRRRMIKALSVTAFIGMGLAAGFSVVGRDLIAILLGPRWDQAGRIFAFFAPGIGAMLLYAGHNWIHLSIGRPDRWFRWSLVEVVVTCSLFFLGLHWGPQGVAAAWTLSYWVLILPALWYAGRPVGFGLAPVIEATWKYVVAAFVARIATTGLVLQVPLSAGGSDSINAFAHLLALGSMVSAFYLAAIVLLNGGPGPLYEFAQLLTEMVSRQKVAESFAFVAATQTGGANEGAGPEGVGRQPLVSILIPSFNAEAWIADTLRSATAQTWPNKEIIVVDDGWSDRTVAIASKFESDGVRIVRQRNQGAAAARNAGLSLSRGEYIQWLDADDLLAPDKIARQMEVFKTLPNKRVVLSSSFGLFKYRYYRATFSPTSLWRDLSTVDWLLCKLGQNAYMQTATWLVPREVSEKAGPWNTQLLGDDDGEYFCRILMASDGVRFVPEAKVYYRAPWVGTLSYIGQSNRKLDAHWRSMQLHIGYLRSLEDTPRARQACFQYLQNCFIYFYPERSDIVEEMQSLAEELGGRLETPRLSWKYSWMQKTLGWKPAKRLQVLAPRDPVVVRDVLGEIPLPSRGPGIFGKFQQNQRTKGGIEPGRAVRVRRIFVCFLFVVSDSDRRPNKARRRWS